MSFAVLHTTRHQHKVPDLPRQSRELRVLLLLLKQLLLLLLLRLPQVW